MSGNLDTPIKNLTSVGKTTALRLKKLGLETVSDLLYFFPTRHDDFTKKRPIKDLVPGEKANVVGQIELIENRRAHRRRMYITEALISDGAESLKVVWFNQPYLTKNLRPGDKVSLAGRVDESYGITSMISPIYEKVGKKGAYHTVGLVPVYRLTDGLTQKQLRFLVKQSLDFLNELEDVMPEKVINDQKLSKLAESITSIHFPKDKKDLEEAKRRLAFDELFLIQLKSQLIKKERDNSKATPVHFNEKKTRDFVSSLPFELTADQKKAAWQALQDMEKGIPMSRLLNGDVGSGKTVVAAITMLNTALNNDLQAAMMAPTEILARQHFESISKTLKGASLQIALLTGKSSLLNGEDIKKPELQKKIAEGKVDIIIGTHALISDKLKFKDLALAVVDEQHRFGVEQRRMLMERSGNTKTSPHLLSMTATPIPRSLSLVLFGDLDISVIKQMPKGRKSIITKVVGDERRNKVYSFMKQQIAEGRQAFVICPLIEESDSLGVKSVDAEFKKLNESIFPNIDMAKLHGRMKPKEKETIMQQFLNGDMKILVSTSVVEVGVDIPNATIMVIEGAQRFGLAQLHQFRGRVGRGEYKSYCALFSESKAPETINRLKAMESLNDGFKLAEMDLQIRGGGEIYGTRQKGFPEMKIATLWDHKLMKEAKEEAVKLMENNPALEGLSELKEKMNRSLKETHLE